MNDLYRKLHATYSPQRFDHTDVWAGGLRVIIGGVQYPSHLARSYSDAGDNAIVEVELYVRDFDWSDIDTPDLEARVWTDANDLGALDERGQYHSGSGIYVPMSIRRDDRGKPELAGNNLVLTSERIPLTTPGVFHYSVAISADGLNSSDPAKRWIPVNDIAFNRDGQIVVSDPCLRDCRSVSEVCIRKVGARLEGTKFESGKISTLTGRIGEISEDVIYLLPFFTPGHKDIHTKQDVRKGTLGSVYSPKAFFEIDPDLVSSCDEIDLAEFVRCDKIVNADLDDLLDSRQRTRVRTVQELSSFSHWKELEDWVGSDVLTQLVGRAELRLLVERAHESGKRVIFDLILMQTSRDCDLIEQHPEWYVTDENGQPAIHKIAWLVYSDVALLDLPFNKPLQNYLSGIAPFWIERCGFDGVRIDASQTVDRPFLKEIKNRIHRVKEDAIVLGETLCALDESQDIPVDMVYALFVDFHRDLNNATPLIDFVEETNRSFSEGTVALAYFENHDSIRASRVWRERYGAFLANDAGLAEFWSGLTGSRIPEVWMAQLKNLQASAINATIGNGGGTRTIYGTEWGTTWGTEAQTDFENTTIIAEDRRGEPPSIYLQQAYTFLSDLVGSSTVLAEGGLTFHRPSDVGDGDDKLLVYSRHTSRETLLLIHNLDHQWKRHATIGKDKLKGVAETQPSLLLDTHSFSIRNNGDSSWEVLPEGDLSVSLKPLQSIILKLT
jgi:glycosidase